MSFQEFASDLFGERDEFEDKAQDAMEINRKKEKSSKTDGSFFESPGIRDVTELKGVTHREKDNREKVKKARGVFEEANELEKDLAEKDAEGFEKEDVETGFIPEWLADKKLSKSKKKSNTIGDKTAVSGIKEHETDDAILLNIKNDRGTSFREKWIPKSQFEEFESSGPELSESKEEKAENVMESRSERARRTDRRNAAPIAGSFDEWKSEPSETDLPGIDTLGSGGDLDDLL